MYIKGAVCTCRVCNVCVAMSCPDAALPLLPVYPHCRSVIVSRSANQTGSASQYLAEASNTTAATTVKLSDDCSLNAADWHVEPIPTTVDCQYDLGDSPYSPDTFNDSSVSNLPPVNVYTVHWDELCLTYRSERHSSLSNCS
jgi:hypothetical protein